MKYLAMFETLANRPCAGPSVCVAWCYLILLYVC